jgi:hypothetical protein
VPPFVLAEGPGFGFEPFRHRAVAGPEVELLGEIHREIEELVALLEQWK